MLLERILCGGVLHVFSNKQLECTWGPRYKGFSNDDLQRNAISLSTELTTCLDAFLNISKSLTIYIENF